MHDAMKGAPTLRVASNSYAALTAPDHAVSASYGRGPFVAAVEMGGGSPRPYVNGVDLDPSSYAVTTLGFNKGRFSLAGSAGRLKEPQGPLGSFLPSMSAQAMPASTKFATVQANLSIADRLMVSAEAGVGRTEVGGALLPTAEPALSSTWRVSLRSSCSFTVTCTHLQIDLAQPVRIESGVFTALLANQGAGYFDPLFFSRRDVDAAPSGREINLRIGLDRATSESSGFQLQFIMAKDQSNVAGAPLSTGAVANWRTRF